MASAYVSYVLENASTVLAESDEGAVIGCGEESEGEKRNGRAMYYRRAVRRTADCKGSSA